MAAVALAAVEVDAPSIHDTIDYRDIAGDTEAALVSGLRRIASANRAGDRFAAHTHWRLRWDFRVESSQGRCRLVSAATRLDVRTTLPRWSAPPAAPPALVQRWNAFSAAVRRHEDGHRAIAVDAARKVAEGVASAAPEPDCDTLKRTLGRIAEQTVRDYREKEDSYDVTTLHGRAQGATFP